MSIRRSLYAIVTTAGVALGLLAAAGTAQAHGGVSWSVGVGAPGVAIGVGAPGPVYYAPPAPVYYGPPAGVYVPPPPVYYRPRPVYYGPPAVVVAPRPYYGYRDDGYRDRGYRDHGRGHYDRGWLCSAQQQSVRAKGCNCPSRSNPRQPWGARSQSDQ